MTEAKKTIKGWLKKIGKDRFWLAERCAVGKTTVDDWFTSRGIIPEAKLELIQLLMEKESLPAVHKSARSEVTLSFVAEEWELIKWCANHMNISIERWIEDCVLVSSNSLCKHGVDQHYAKPETRDEGKSSLPQSDSKTA